MIRHRQPLPGTNFCSASSQRLPSANSISRCLALSRNLLIAARRCPARAASVSFSAGPTTLAQRSPTRWQKQSLLPSRKVKTASAKLSSAVTVESAECKVSALVINSLQEPLQRVHFVTHRDARNATRRLLVEPLRQADFLPERVVHLWAKPGQVFFHAEDLGKNHAISGGPVIDVFGIDDQVREHLGFVLFYA